MFKHYIKNKPVLPIPHTDDAFFVSVDGVVTTARGDVVPIVKESKCNYVTLPWILGEIPYSLDFVMLSAFKPLFLDPTQWNGLVVMYADGDDANHQLNNLVWKIPVRTESIKYPGYYHIPAYTRYGISDSLRVIDLTSGVEITPYIDYKGYYRFSLRCDDGVWRSIGRHRANCLINTDYPANADNLVVNHIDGVPGNDAIDNLELVTNKENILHAVRLGLQNVTREVGYMDVHGNTELYSSLKNMIEDKAINVETFYSAVKKDGYLPNGAKVFYLKDDSRHVPRTAVLVRDVRTGEVHRYPSIKQAAKAYEMTVRAFTDRLNLEGQPLLANYTQIQRESNAKPWREVDLANEKLYDNPTRKIKVRDVVGGKEWVFESMVMAAEHFGITKDAVAWRVNAKDQPVFEGKYQYLDYTKNTPWREPEPHECHQHNYGVRANPIQVRDVTTGKITTYSRQTDFAREHGISVPTVNLWLSRPRQPVLPGLIQIKLLSDYTPWRIPEESELVDTTFKCNKWVEVRESATGKIMEFSSAKECADHFGILTTTMNWRLKSKGQKVYSDGFQFKYKDDPTPWLE